MTHRLLALALVGTLAASSIGAYAQRKPARRTALPPAIPRTGGETGLLGIKLYDAADRILTTFGSPDDLQAVTLGGGGGIGPAAGGPNPGGMPGGPGGMPGGYRGGPPPGVGGPVPPGGKPAGGPPRLSSPGGGGKYTFPDNGLIGDPFGLGPRNLNQVMPDEAGGRMGGPGGGLPGAPGGMGNGAGGFGRPGGAGMPGGFGGATASESVEFTRWVYNEPAVRLAFIVDKFNKVVQIEAIGLTGASALVNNKKVAVTTRRKISFGATFAQIMARYQNPDGYDISGDSFVVRFLVRDKVAFRLTRLQPGKPQQVTAIVIAAGKQ